MGYELWDDDTVRGIAAGFWAAGADAYRPTICTPKATSAEMCSNRSGDPATMDLLDKRYLTPLHLVMGYTRHSRHSLPSCVPARYARHRPIANTGEYKHEQRVGGTVCW